MKDTYFVLINDTRKMMKKGSQAYLNYGFQTNAKLLMDYGFSIQDNVFDSY